MRQSSESLAGRIIYHELTGLDLLETAPHDLEKLWMRGGFPESFLARSDGVSRAWRGSLVRTVLERDVPHFAPRLPAEAMRRLWTMLAHEQGGTLNAAKLARSLEVSASSVFRYIDTLTDLLLVRRLRPFHANVRKRVVKAPKIYIRDSGLVHSILGINSLRDLLAHPVVGGSWEGFVVENLLAVLPPDGEAYYYRTHGGAEIDLLVKMPGGILWAVEIKRSSSPAATRGFHSACEDLSPERRIVAHSGPDAFPLKGEVEALPVSSLMKELLAIGNQP